MERTKSLRTSLAAAFAVVFLSMSSTTFQTARALAESGATPAGAARDARTGAAAPIVPPAAVRQVGGETGPVPLVRCAGAERGPDRDDDGFSDLCGRNGLDINAFVLTPLLIALPSPSAATQERGVGGASSQASAASYHALVIGNNIYASLPRLKTAEADARAVAVLLKDSYGFETNLLLNATRAQIISALAGYRRRLGSEARLLVYYAGHGYYDREQDKAYWLPVDASADDPVNWIIADEITSAIRVVPARHVLVVSDSCYSGTLTRDIGASLPPAAERERFLHRMAAGRSRMLMASGGDEPVADGGGGEHSVFAGALLRGLREIDKSKFTASELFRYYVEERVAGRAEQLPEYNPLRNSGHEGGDFVFMRSKIDGKTAGAVPAAGLASVEPASIELAFWNSIQNNTNPEDFKDYPGKYPQGQFAGLARKRLDSLNGCVAKKFCLHRILR